MSRITHTPTRDLLPCPFCGSERTDLVIIEQPNAVPEGPGWWCVKCSFCRTEGPEDRTAGGAIRAWNRRRAGQ